MYMCLYPLQFVRVILLLNALIDLTTDLVGFGQSFLNVLMVRMALGCVLQKLCNNINTGKEINNSPVFLDPPTLLRVLLQTPSRKGGRLVDDHPS